MDQEAGQAENPGNKQKRLKKRAYISIKTALSIPFFALILLISLCISIFFLRLHKDIVEHYIRSKAIYVVHSMGIESAPHIHKGEYDYIREHVKNIAMDTDILYAAIFDPEGFLVEESDARNRHIAPMIDPAEVPKNDVLFRPIKDERGIQTGYDVYMEIMLKNQRIGLSRIIISFIDIEKNLTHIRNTLIILVCLIALLGGIIVFLMSSFITKPLQELAKAAEKIANGDFNTTIPIQTNSEIDLLAQSLNEMTKNIRQYRDKIIKQGNELKAIIDSMGSGVFTVDKEWRITSFNKSAEQITGYTQGEAIGKTCEEVFQTDACHCACPLENALMAGRSIISNDFFIKNKNGKKIPISASTSPLKNEKGEIIGGVEVFKDLTEIKDLQKQLIQADKMAALGQMISGIAHDINNPTGVIHSNMIALFEYTESIKGILVQYRALAQSLSADVPDQPPMLKEIREYEKNQNIDYILEDLECLVEESKEAASRITQIVKDLRDFIHIDVGQLQLADLNQRLDVSLNLIKFGKDIKVKKEYSPLPSIYGNIHQLDQVFTNILLNAAQALRDKGEIRIRTSHKDERVIVSVFDNGPGIPEDIQSKIFDPFFTTKDVGEGTGLGLSICYTIVSKHGGRIWVESEPGKWTEFFVELPINLSQSAIES